MKIVLEIPKEFEEHFNKDRFKDALERINVDVRSLKFEGLAGQYELETLEMLITVLKTAVPVSIYNKLYLNSIYGKSALYADTDNGFMKAGSDTNVPATRNYKRITDTQLEEVRVWLIDNVMEDAEIMFSDDIRNAKPDLVEVVASLYELLHREVTGQSYLYMFHWANKIGSWVENERIFTDMLEKANKMKLDEIKKTLEEVQNMCKATTHCAEECPFYKGGAERFTHCVLDEWPENWLLDQINERKGD